MARERLGRDELERRVFVECQIRGLPPVSRNALKARTATISPRELLKKREGARAAREAFDLVEKRYSVERPLAVMQIDHTELDLFIVDEEDGRVLGRPYLTVCLDVASRIICGFRISFDPLSAVSLMRAFSSAVRVKPPQLEQLGLEAHWPAFGLPEAVHTDNGGDLTSAAFELGLAEYGIEHIRRPLGRPNWGGHIERILRTQNSLTHRLPGTTRSNIAQRGNRAPEKQACLTLTEIRTLFASYICDVYHKTRHSGLGDTPLHYWERYWAERGESPRLPRDISAFERQFLPVETRAIGPYGISFNTLSYRSRLLQRMRDNGVKSVRFRYDPDDARKIYVDADGKDLEPVPCEKSFHRAVSFQELKLLRDQIGTNTHRWSDADLIKHYQLHDEILAKGKKRKVAQRATGQGKRLSSSGALKPEALGWSGGPSAGGFRDEL